MVSSRKQSISALQLQKDCRIGSYESAWFLLHRIRQALTERNDGPLRGPQLEVDEPMIAHGDGVRPAIPFGRQTTVGLAIERWQGRAGRIRMMPHVNDIHVTFCFIERLLGAGEPQRARGLLSRTLAANLATWLAGTFHGVSGKYMFAYVREFVFRFNRRRRERALPALAASTVLRTRPRDRSALSSPSDEEYPLSAP